MSSSIGLFQIDLYQIDETVPARAEMTTDPLGQVWAVISAYLPEGVGSRLYAWQETAYLRADFARQKVELVRLVESEQSIEGEWELDIHDDDVREYLFLYGSDDPDAISFALLASWAPDLRIALPDPGTRQAWGDDRSFVEGAPDEDWTGPTDDG